ncbi:hypothetical protein Tco_1361075 [Tanacetum coccineum]
MEECHKLLTNQVDDAILRTALSISKMKVAYYPDVGLEQLVPDQFWIEEECKYDIAAMYGDRQAVRTHMRILSVVRIEVFSMYGYNYMKKIVLRRADLKEYVIAERDFKHMYPSDFEDLYLLNLQGHLNHLSPEDKKILTTAVNLWTRNLVIRHRVEDFQLGIESYQTQLNLTKPRWEATGFEFKHDYTVIDSPRAVTFRDRYGVQMIMRFNEIHKFSDGTLQQIEYYFLKVAYSWSRGQPIQIHVVKDKILATPSETSKVENAPAEMLRDLDQQMEKRADDGCTLWIKLYSKYEYEIRYHPGRANVVIDALRRKERVKPRRVRAMAMTIQYGVRGMILAAQSEAFKQENGMMRTVVMDEAHASRFRWMIYLIVLADAAESDSDAIRFEYCLASSRGWTKSPVIWAEIGGSSLIGPELVQETTNKVVLVKENPKAAGDCQKSYADNRRKPLEFEVGDRVMLKVSP